MSALNVLTRYNLPNLLFGVAGRLPKDEDVAYWRCLGNNPRFGFYWWRWLPRLGWNGGKLNWDDVVDIYIMWLCFNFGLTLWPKPI